MSETHDPGEQPLSSLDQGVDTDDDEVEVRDEGTSLPDVDADADEDAGEPAGEQRTENEAPQPGVELGGGQAQVRGRRSASDRYQQLANANRQLRERIAAIEQQSTVGNQQQLAEQQRRQAELERQQEEQVLQSMDPAAIGRFYAQRTQAQVQREMQITRYQMFDANDQANFSRELAANPRLNNFYERNRDRFDELRRLVPGAARLDILDKVFGEVARRQMLGAGTRQQNRATVANGRLETRAPAQSRSNVPGERGTSGRVSGRRDDFSHMRDVLI